MERDASPGTPPSTQSNLSSGPAIFTGDVVILGGSIVQHNVGHSAETSRTSVNGTDAFRTLKEHVATSAFYDSMERGNPPKCHPGTREAVFEDILKWISCPKGTQRAKWVLWLNGAAGSGKTAIEQSLAELCSERGIPAVTFFFFHADHTRNTLKPVIATLAYQLIQLVPPTREFIAEKIASDPLIFQRTFEAQLQALIIQPLNKLRQASGASTQGPELLIIIDSLDDCIASGRAEQSNIIRAFTNLYATKKSYPIIVIVGSRIENQLTSEFASADLSGILQTISLDGQRYDPEIGTSQRYDPDPDIRTFLAFSFDQIKRNHHLKDAIDHNWPVQAIVNEILTRSSGQFIYASVVIQFISSSPEHPPTQLDMILSDNPAGGLATAAFTELDELYHRIFTRIDEESKYVKAIAALLACVILTNETKLATVAALVNIPQLELRAALNNLTSVIAIRSGQIHFLHASLLSFILDETRSQKYHINTATWASNLCHEWFQSIESGAWNRNRLIDLIRDGEEYHPHLQEALRKCVDAFDPDQISKEATTFPFLYEFLAAITKSNVYNEEICDLQINRLTRFVKENCPENISDLRKAHRSVDAILDDIEREQKAEVVTKPINLNSEVRQGEKWSITTVAARVKQRFLRARNNLPRWFKSLRISENVGR